jgi:hypothetical protein
MNTWDLYIRLNDKGFASMHHRMKQEFEAEIPPPIWALMRHHLYTPLTFLGWDALHSGLDEALRNQLSLETQDI